MTVPTPSGVEITRDDIEQAARRIAGHIRRTPILDMGAGPGECRLSLKLDLLQPTGSFKIRGATSLLTAHPEARRVVTASGGNFGLAIAHAASRLGVGADIFVPATSPPVKAARIRAAGAEVHIVDGHYAEALAAAEQFESGGDVLFAHAYDQAEVVAGQGTCGREIATQDPDVDTVVVAVGGAGLIGGIASWFRDDVRIVAAETHGTATLHAALAAGHPVVVAVGGLAADSLGASEVGRYGFEASRRWVDEVCLVSDEDVRSAQRWLWSEVRLIAEPGGAAALAAVLSGAYRTEPDERVCVLVCGANTDPSVVAGLGDHEGRVSSNMHQPSS
ncbi:threonine/serine dehydratase [soil metagenome]